MIAKTYFDINPRNEEYLIIQKGNRERIKQVLFQTPCPKSKEIFVRKTYHNNLLLKPDTIDEEEIYLQTHIKRLKDIYKQGKNSVENEVINLKEFIISFAGLRLA